MVRKGSLSVGRFHPSPPTSDTPIRAIPLERHSSLTAPGFDQPRPHFGRTHRRVGQVPGPQVSNHRLPTEPGLVVPVWGLFPVLHRLSAVALPVRVARLSCEQDELWGLRSCIRPIWLSVISSSIGINRCRDDGTVRCPQDPRVSR